MVTWQSTQNTCKGFLGLQNGLSVWFTRLHNHGEDCWSDRCPEDNHSQGGKTQTFITKEAVHRVLYPSMLTESWVEGKDAQPTERTAALWGLSSKIDSRIWVNFTRNGLRLGSRHQEHHTQTCRGIWLQLLVRGVLPGLREEELDCCPVVQSPLFRWEQVLYFIWKPRS